MEMLVWFRLCWCFRLCCVSCIVVCVLCVLLMVWFRLDELILNKILFVLIVLFRCLCSSMMCLVVGGRILVSLVGLVFIMVGRLKGMVIGWVLMVVVFRVLCSVEFVGMMMVLFLWVSVGLVVGFGLSLLVMSGRVLCMVMISKVVVLSRVRMLLCVEILVFMVVLWIVWLGGGMGVCVVKLLLCFVVVLLGCCCGLCCRKCCYDRGFGF